MATERFVFFRPGALGDALLAFPALALVRHARPEAHVSFVARGDVLPLARSSRLADAVHSYDLPAWSALFAADPAAADPLAYGVLAGAEVVVWAHDPDGTIASNVQALGGLRAVVAPGRPDPDDRGHMALQLSRALSQLGIAVPGEVERLRQLLPPLRPPSEDARRAGDAWARLGLQSAARVVALHPGSGGIAKRWPPAAFGALADAIRSWGIQPLLVEGPQDGAICAAVQAASRLALPIARELTVGALAALLSRCAGYVGNDSGVSHLAALCGMPTLTLFGPTDPAVWAPLGRQVRVLRSPEPSMERLALDVVVGALRDLLGLGTSPDT